MTMFLKLTPRDCEYLTALVMKVRLFNLRQISVHWWNGEIANARRRLKQLKDAGLIIQASVMTRPLPPIVGPIISWKPGDREPDFGSVAHALQKRWKNRPLRPCAAFLATERCAQVFGGKARAGFKQATQATHDLGVAEVWLLLRRSEPAMAEAWQGEDLLAHTRRGEKCPDAFIVRDDEIVAVADFGSAYGRERVADFHSDCVARDLPYFLY